jgi:hypothetical protein
MAVTINTILFDWFCESLPTCEFRRRFDCRNTTSIKRMSAQGSSSALPSLNAIQDSAGGLFKSLGSALSPLGAKVGKSLSSGRQYVSEKIGSADVTELPQEWVSATYCKLC